MLLIKVYKKYYTNKLVVKYNKKIKYSRILSIRSSFIEKTNKLVNWNQFIELSSTFHKKYFNTFFYIKDDREVANIVLKDLLGFYLTWRQVKGYPCSGQTTHTNSKTARKSKLLLNFRIRQFNKIFGNKKRNIYPTLVKAEYTNKLWYQSWILEWREANKFSIKMANLKGKGGNIFNPVLTAGNQTNGYTRCGKAAKIGKAKKLVKVFTIGIPIFFTRYIYYPHPPKGFPTKLYLKDEVNKKLGKKLRRQEWRNLR